MTMLNQLSEVFHQTYNETAKNQILLAAKQIFGDLFVHENGKTAVEMLVPNQGIGEAIYSIKYIGQHYGKIPAIKYLRELTGLGLKEAKEKVEQIFDLNNLEFGSYNAPSKELNNYQACKNRVIELIEIKVDSADVAGTIEQLADSILVAIKNLQ